MKSRQRARPTYRLRKRYFFFTLLSLLVASFYLRPRVSIPVQKQDFESREPKISVSGLHTHRKETREDVLPLDDEINENEIEGAEEARLALEQAVGEGEQTVDQDAETALERLTESGSKQTEAAKAVPAIQKNGRPKEIIHDDASIDYSSILEQLIIPKSPTWDDDRLHRLVVSQAHPENKFDTKGETVAADWMPPVDLTVQYASCAVVGNGGVNLVNDYGAAIDNHEAVFRFNDGPTEGFESKVGTKTTYRLINNNWARSYQKKHPKGASEEALVLFGHGSARACASLQKKWPNEQVYFMAPEFAGNARGMYKKSYTLMNEMGFIEIAGRNSPPTGIEGVFWARALCDKLHIYGFNVADNLDPSIPYHYHDKVEGEIGAHSFNFQAIFLKMLSSAGHFKICVPGLEAPECNWGV